MRKTTMVFAAILCLLAQVLSAGISQCLIKNPFLKEMTKSGQIKAQLIPSKKVTQCIGEWDKNGSCCKADSAAIFAKKDQNCLKMATSATAIAMQNLNNYFNMIWPELKVWMDKSPLPSRHTILNNLFGLMKSVGVINIAAHEKCWLTELGKLRASSLCSTCSGKSLRFFQKDKALVSMATCSAMLNNCFPSISQIVTFIRTAEELYARVKDLATSMSLKIRLLDGNSALAHSFATMRQKNVAGLLETYDREKGTKKGNQAAVQLCQDFMSIHKAPLIVQVLELMMELLHGLNYLKSASNDIGVGVEDYLIKKHEQDMHNQQNHWTHRAKSFFEMIGQAIANPLKKHIRQQHNIRQEFQLNANLAAVKVTLSVASGTCRATSGGRKLFLGQLAGGASFSSDIQIFDLPGLQEAKKNLWNAANLMQVATGHSPMNLSMVFP